MPLARAATALLVLLASAAAGSGQSPAQQTPEPQTATQPPAPFTLRAGARLVFVPATVAVKGKLLYGLRADQFTLTDNGVPRTLTLDEDADTQALSLVVLLQCSRSAVMEYSKIEALPQLLENLIGGAPHEVALVRYGSHPELVLPFTRKLDKVEEGMRGMGPCEDDKAATIDAVSYAASILGNRPEGNRRAILLLSESRDHGSTLKEREVIAQLGRSNIVVDAFAYSPLRDELGDDLKHGGGPGAVGLLAELIGGIRRNASKSLASLSGGDYFGFSSRKDFEAEVGKLTNRIHNFYLLSFPLPTTDEPGLHELRLHVPEYPEASIRARRYFWVDEQPASSPSGESR